MKKALVSALEIVPHLHVLRVKTGKARSEHMFSALPLKADVAQRGRHVRLVPTAEVVSCLHSIDLSPTSMRYRLDP